MIFKAIVTANDIQNHKLNCRKCPYCAELLGGNSLEDHRLFCAKYWSSSSWKAEDSSNNEKWSPFDNKLSEIIVENIIYRISNQPDSINNSEKVIAQNAIKKLGEINQRLTETFIEKDKIIEDLGRENSVLREIASESERTVKISQKNYENCARENLEYRELVENFTYKVEEQDEQMKQLIEDKQKLGRDLEILQEKFALVFEENESQRQRYEILGVQLTETVENLETVTVERQVLRQKLDELQAETDEKLTEIEQSFETLPIRKMSIPR